MVNKLHILSGHGRRASLASWGLFALALLTPGSFLILPLLWLVRRFRAAPARVTTVLSA